MDLNNAVCYDIETFPNVFTLDMEMLHSDVRSTWEISHYRDDRRELFAWLDWMMRTATPAIGFNTIHFDYPVIHYIWTHPNATVEEIYQFAMSIINSNDKFAYTVWEKDRIFPQIDLFKIHHFDNRAKTTSLKALQINMRLDNVIDMPVEIGKFLTPDEINTKLIPYGKWDVKSTKQFAHYSMQAILFRKELVPQFGVDVMNWNDSKIGSKILEQRLGDDLCYDRSSGRRVMRQTPRDRIALRDIILPFIRFDEPEFQRVLEYMRNQVLTPADIEEASSEYKIQAVQTKGVFSGLKAVVGGVEFKFGTGGIHGSVSKQRIIATDEWLIRDIDVASLYPSIAIVNGFAPEHLGEAFTREYANLPKERKEWQKKKGKKCVEANSIKLAGNGTYGNSNSVYSIFYDPKYTMTITINGQLMLAMLAEWLMRVPTLKIIQANTDGITYTVHRDYEWQAAMYCKQWQELTKLTLEDVNYRRMFIADVNTYIAEDMDGNLKQKGRLWHPDPLNYAQSISEAQPPAWHKDLSNIASIRAAVSAMIYGIEPRTFLSIHGDKFDFMCRIKVGRSDKLLLNGVEIQKTSRYYVAKQGGNLVKVSPPTGPLGAFKRKTGVTEYQWQKRMTETGGQWCETVCTKNKSQYEQRETAIEAGYRVAICNDANDFNWSNVNYEWYIEEARKLVI